MRCPAEFEIQQTEVEASPAAATESQAEERSQAESPNQVTESSQAPGQSQAETWSEAETWSQPEPQPQVRAGSQAEAQTQGQGQLQPRAESQPEIDSPPEAQSPPDILSGETESRESTGGEGASGTEANEPFAGSTEEESPGEREALAAAAGEPGAIAAAESPSETAAEDVPLSELPFGSTDPNARARRLARALVSDILVYHRDRRDRSLREGTIRQDFRDEIRKSWDEYVAQVGNEMARETSYFQEALNEILAGGARNF